MTTKSTVELLSVPERTALALWYDTQSYRAFKKLMEHERLNIATKLLDVPADDAITIARHQGRAEMCKKMHLTFKDNYRAHVRTEESLGKNKQKS